LPSELGFLWVFLGIVIAVVVHEGGHLVCALAMRIPVRQVTVGVGPLVFRRRIGETHFELRLVPTAGFVAPYPIALIRRWRYALFLLGGVLANAVAIVVVAVLAAKHAWPRSAEDVIGPMVFVQPWVILASLAPFSFGLYGARIGTDGRQLLQLLRVASGEPTATAELYARELAIYALGATPGPLTAASSRIMYQIFRRDRWTDPEAGRECVEALQRELERDALLAAEEIALIIDSLVTYALVFGDATLRPQLDALTQGAVALAPVRTLYGSRGAALIEIGRYEEGKEILESLIAQSGLDPFDAFMIEVHLARAERGLGDQQTAANWAARARRRAASCQTPVAQLMLARMEAELKADPNDLVAV
jgi:hypothetical protein